MENRSCIILAIDDNQDNLIVLKALFGEIFPNAKLITALSGKEGIEKSINEMPDVILLDIVMPFMDGYEVCRFLKNNDTLKHIPVIMITAARTDKESRIKALDAGADAFLAKPVDESELTAQIKAMLRIKESEDHKLNQKVWLEKLVDERTDALKKELEYRKKAEEALHVTEQNLQTLFNTMTEAVALNEAITGPNGEIIDYRILNVNKSYYSIIPLPPEQVIGQLASKIYNLSSEKIGSFWKENKAKNTTVYTEMLIAETNQWFHITTSPLKDNRFVTTFFDITERKKAEKALINSEERFKQVVETSGVWIWEVDTEGLYTYASLNGESILGYKPEEIIGKKYFYDFFTPDVKEELKKAGYEAFSKRDSLRNFINPNLHKNGQVVILETSGLPLYDEKGNFIGYRGADRDITQRENARRMMKASEEKFAASFNNAPVLMTISEFETGRYIDVNQRFLEVSGFSRDEVIGKTSVEIGWISQIGRDLIKNEFVKNNKVSELELHLKKKNGEDVIALYNGELITIDGKTRILSLAVDITSSKRADEALRESEYFFKESQRAAFVGSYQTNFKTGFWESSEVLDQIFGIDKGYERNIQGWLDLVHPFDKELMQRHLNEDVMRRKQLFNKEYRIIRKVDGITRWVHGLGKAAFDEFGRIISLTGTIQDITERKEAEEKLNETLNNLKRSQEIANIGNWQLDLSNQKFSASAEGLKQFGFPPDYQPTFDEVRNQFHPDDQTLAHDALEKALLSESSYSVEMQIIKKDTGEIRNILSIGEVEKNKNGNPIRIFGINQDITERKHAELTIKESEIRFKNLFENAADAIFIADAETGIIVDANQASSRLMNMPVEKIIGLHQTQLHPPENESYSKETFEDSLAHANRLKPVHAIETQVLRSDGTKIPVEVLASSVVLHRKQCLMGTFRDITLRKRNEKIQQIIFNISNASLTSINLDDFMGLIKKEIGTLIDTTNFFIALYDEDADAITLPYYIDKKDNYTSFPAGKTMTAYVIRSRKSVLAKRDTLARLEAAGTIETIGSTSKVWMGVPLSIKGKVTGAIVVQSYDDENAYTHEDMKMLEFVAGQINLAIERKKTEQDLNDALIHARESDRLKSAFLATMSHELRTPLNAVIGFSELIGEDIPMESIIDFAHIINNSGAQLLELVEEIFDITLLESGHLKIKQEEFLINPLLTEIYETISIDQQKMSKEDIRIRFNPIIADNDFVVFSDPRKLKQIFMNLLKNALKFTHNGFVEFGYHKITNQEASFIEFYVKDTGIGIPTESRELIFEIFRQGDDSHTRNFGGTGIGLSVAKKLTELLGGKISVDSKVNVGSTFYFTIPYTNNNNHLQVIAEKMPALAPNYYPGKTILVAEDEDSNYELLEVLIKLTSARVIRAKDGQEAIDLCKTVPEINMVLMDLKMPGTTGYQATIEIKKIRPGLPIIAQTAYAMPGDRSKALEAGCDDYLSKPIKKQPLMEKIEKFLGV